MDIINVVGRTRWLCPSGILLWLCRVRGGALGLLGGLANVPDAAASAGVC